MASALCLSLVALKNTGAAESEVQDLNIADTRRHMLCYNWMFEPLTQETLLEFRAWGPRREGETGRGWRSTGPSKQWFENKRSRKQKGKGIT